MGGSFGYGFIEMTASCNLSHRSVVCSLQEARLELDEFQEGSRELEAELEAQLEQAESRARDLASIKSRLEAENEALKERLEAVQNESFVMISSLQEEIATLSLHRDTLQKYVRELEQSNDDLERSQRYESGIHSG